MSFRNILLKLTERIIYVARIRSVDKGSNFETGTLPHFWKVTSLILYCWKGRGERVGGEVR